MSVLAGTAVAAKGLIRLLVDELNVSLAERLDIRKRAIDDRLDQEREQLSRLSGRLTELQTDLDRQVAQIKADIERRTYRRDLLVRELAVAGSILDRQRKAVGRIEETFGDAAPPGRSPAVETDRKTGGVVFTGPDAAPMYSAYVGMLGGQAATEARVSNLKARIAEAEAAIEAQEREYGRLKKSFGKGRGTPETRRIEQEIDSTRAVIDRLLEEKRSLFVLKLRGVPDVRRIEPTPPRYLFLAVAGLSGGLVVALLLAFFVEFVLRHRTAILTPSRRST